MDEEEDDEKALLSIMAELDEVPQPSAGKTVPLPASENDIEPVAETEGIPFWAKCLAGATGIVAALMQIVLGSLNFILNILSPRGMVSSAFQILLGVLIILIEAPVCCPNSYRSKFYKKVGRVKYLHRGIIYSGLSIIILYLNIYTAPISTLLIIILPFASGVMYGLMSLGLKADRDIMMAAARSQQTPTKFIYSDL